MVSAKRSSIQEHDSPVDSFFNSLHVVRESLIPIESGIQRAAIDLQSHWLGSQNFDSHKKSSSIRVPSKSFWGSVFQKKGLKERENRDNEDGLCSNCLGFAVSWSLMINSFMQTIPSPFKSVKKCFQKQCSDGDDCLSSSLRIRVSPSRVSSNKKQSKIDEENKNGFKEGEVLSLEILLGFLFDHLFRNLDRLNQSNRAKNESKNTEQELGFLFDRLFQNLNRLNQSNRAKNEPKNAEQELGSKNGVLNDSNNQFNPFEVFANVLKGRKADVDCLLVNLGFAKMGGVPGLVGVASVKDDCQDNESGNREQESSSALKVGAGLLQIPLSNVERLKSTLSTVSLAEMVELVTQLGRTSKDYPDKKKLFSVQDFFRYTQAEGRRFFEELDRDGDGQVTLEDLEIAMRKRRLPHRYAREFLRRTRSHLFAKSFGWRQFLSLMEQKEPTILRAYTTLCLSKSGTLQKSQILASLQDAGLPANEENVMAMMRCLDVETEGSISYGHFRNFMLLLPSERLEDDPRSIWFEAATVVAVAPPVEIPAGSVLKSALAGGLASALSTSLMHPVDTMKTRVQASTLSFPELVSNLPLIGLKGLYRGCIPAVLGQFSSHGLRTGIYEASKLLLINIAPSVPEIQAQSLASFCSTILGTAVRIPCEVLKQRLQAGIFDNVGEAIVGTFQQDGVKGFFRGTGATLCREVPFYVAGMGLYEESKKAAQRLLRRDLEPWETIAVGALSGGLAAVVTTPFDVMKTRMMTAPQGVPVTMTVIAFSILRNEGPLGLLKGAVPRFFWIAPLGAMNFAGYELAKKAMNKTECLGTTNDHLREKKLAKAG